MKRRLHNLLSTCIYQLKHDWKGDSNENFSERERESCRWVPHDPTILTCIWRRVLPNFPYNKSQARKIIPSVPNKTRTTETGVMPKIIQFNSRSQWYQVIMLVTLGLGGTISLVYALGHPLWFSFRWLLYFLQFTFIRHNEKLNQMYTIMCIIKQWLSKNYVHLNWHEIGT